MPGHLPLSRLLRVVHRQRCQRGHQGVARAHHDTDEPLHGRRHQNEYDVARVQVASIYHPHCSRLEKRSAEDLVRYWLQGWDDKRLGKHVM